VSDAFIPGAVTMLMLLCFVLDEEMKQERKASNEAKSRQQHELTGSRRASCLNAFQRQEHRRRDPRLLRVGEQWHVGTEVEPT
jgi:hypothetical protein